MALPTTALYQSVLPTPHRRSVRIDVEDINGVERALDVPVSGGSVSAKLTDRVTRTATFQMDDTWYPRPGTASVLTPYIAVVRIYAGIQYGDGTYERFPVFTGRVSTATRNPDGDVTFKCDDLANDVVSFPFEQPWVARLPTVDEEWQAIIREALPQAVFDPARPPADAPTPQLVWDEDRGKACDDLAEAVGCRWFTRGDGSFTRGPFSYEGAPLAQTFNDGPGGLLHTATASITRDGTANSVVVVSERTDGTEPVRVVERDLAPDSPTLYGGLFGKASQILKVQTPLTSAQAQTLARTQLNAARALTEQWTASVTPDHSLEPADTTRLNYRGIVADQVIDSITYPLLTGAPMRLTGRAIVSQDVINPS